MFVCRACLRSLSGVGATPIESRLLRPLRRTTALGTSRRTYYGGSIQVDMRSVLADASTPAASSPAATTPPKVTVQEADGGEEEEGGKTDELGKKKYEKKLQWVVMKHLEHMKNPFHIAQHVSAALAKGSFDEAMLMTRIASRDAKVEVSWNHLIDYQLQRKRLHAAVKLYNEMKKRAQVPNARTYTIIFRGCADSIHPKLAVAEATRIYNFMLNLGALKPNTIHMNAVLEVCARANDLESMFTILKSANESTRAPDAHTFTIVLNALRHDSGKPDGGLGLIDQDAKNETQKQIQRASAVWADVIARWRGAKLLVDEPLVCAMGRILLTGDYKDNESVLDLLEQTMKIPRLDKVGGKLPPPPEGVAERKDEADAKSHAATPSLEQAPVVNNLSPKQRRELAASRANQAPLYARPGPNTLSLALSALTNIKKTSNSMKYWEYFTKVLGITPDRSNYYAYLRALKTGHASKQIAALVEAFPPEMLGNITFRIALAACQQDLLNKYAFRNACKIYDMMVSNRRYSDARSMRVFLQIARYNANHFLEDHNNDEKAAKRAHGKQIVTALDRMWEPFRILLGSFSYPEIETGSKEELLQHLRGVMQEAMATARRMISALDFVVQEEMVDHKTIKTLKARRIILQMTVERYILKLYPDKPKPPKKKRPDRKDRMAKRDGEMEDHEESPLDMIADIVKPLQEVKGRPASF